MNENTTPQIAGSQPNPAEIGIPSVAGKKTSPVKNRNLALMAALVVLMLVCIAFGFYQKHSARNTPPKPQEQATPMFSGRTLTLPPLSQIQPPEPQPTQVVVKEPVEPKPEKELIAQTTDTASPGRSVYRCRPLRACRIPSRKHGIPSGLRFLPET